MALFIKKLKNYMTDLDKAFKALLKKELTESQKLEIERNKKNPKT